MDATNKETTTMNLDNATQMVAGCSWATLAADMKRGYVPTLRADHGSAEFRAAVRMLLGAARAEGLTVYAPEYEAAPVVEAVAVLTRRGRRTHLTTGGGVTLCGAVANGRTRAPKGITCRRCAA